MRVEQSIQAVNVHSGDGDRQLAQRHKGAGSELDSDLFPGRWRRQISGQHVTHPLAPVPAVLDRWPWVTINSQGGRASQDTHAATLSGR